MVALFAKRRDRGREAVLGVGTSLHWSMKKEVVWLTLTRKISGVFPGGIWSG
jgi:hypothetical protein